VRWAIRSLCRRKAAIADWLANSTSSAWFLACGPPAWDRRMIEQPQELAGRVAIVTGAGRNIGRAIALELAAAGAAVIVNARSNHEEAHTVVREILAEGGRALAFLGDVAETHAVDQMVMATTQRFGRIDILVNNAALRVEIPFQDMTLRDWRNVLDVTLDGAFNCTKAALPQLRASGVGAIVNIGGLSAHSGARNRAHVVTAKAGLVGFTRALAHDLAADNVTVNCVAPGLIQTAREPGAPEPAHHRSLQPLRGQRGTPGDIAGTVRFLCGPGARYISGQTIHVNGGAFLG
jgi:3-oxoacyl-[acyl-carrier protein] reductase